MKFTNTDCVREEVWYQVDWHIAGHSYGQVKDPMYVQVWVQVWQLHQPMKVKILQEMKR